MGKNLKTNDFIIKAVKIHGDKYDYSKINYVNSKTKIEIICPIHGNYEQRPDHHLITNGCQKCGSEIGSKNRIKDITYFINKVKLIHGNKYEYNTDNYKVDNKLRIICRKHGEFEQTIDNHLKGKGCPKCNGKNKTTEEIINEFINIHGNVYNYSKVIYSKIKDKVIIICDKHGEFKQSPEEHINGCGCPICRESRGEREIRQYLMNNNIQFIPQHKFPNCKNILPLPFDFYLPYYNTCIEYNGEQHYKPIKIFGGDEKFLLTQKRDKIKEKYCKKHNIKLITIPYNEKITDFLVFL